MITHIFHISDIHIFEKNYVNIRNSWQQLISDILGWPNYRTTTILVITGDIFEFKTYLNSDDVHLFYEMMYDLERNQIRTIIIPGNHDYNINSKCAQDNISILLGATTETAAWKYISCYAKSGIYIEQQLAFNVFSPIDKIIPARQSNGLINIALLHEPVISAQFDNNENIHNGRFKLEELAPRYDMVMLGDIHRPQFLAPNTAYAGSFVQKNRGEGLNHGYILWDVTTKTGAHYWIALKEVAVKLVAKDNVFVAPLPEIKATITYLALIYQNCSADWIQSAAETIRNKYRRPISQIIRRESTKGLKIDVPNSLQMDMSKLTHTNLITQILQESKTDDTMIRRVLDYHNKFLQNRQLYPTVRYYIKYLAWSNVFCYGPNNYINFEDLRGLVALSGRNKIGKSSVIDILIRILFNECERGHKDDIINKHAKSAYIKCCFRILNDEYIIEQSWQKYTTATTFHLYRNGEDITKDTLVKTYKYIREELGLGNYKDFVNLTTAMQNRQFIVDLDKKDMYSLLCKLLDIDMMRDIEEHVKKERDFLRREKKAKLKELSELGTEENSEDAWNKEVGAIEMRIAELNKTKDELDQAVCNHRDAIYLLNRKIQQVDLDADWQPYDSEKQSPRQFPFDALTYSELSSQLDTLKISFGIQKEKLQQFDKLKIKSIKTAYSENNFADLFAYFGTDCTGLDQLLAIDKSRIIELENKASQHMHNILPCKTNLSYEELLKVPSVEYDLEQLYRQLKPCRKVDPTEVPSESIEELECKLQECKTAQKHLTAYKARRNVVQEIIRYTTDAAISNSSLEEYLQSMLIKYNDQYGHARQVSKLDITQIELQLDNARNWQTSLHNVEIESKIAAHKLYSDANHDLAQHSHREENLCIERARALHNKYLDAKHIQEYNIARQSLLDLKEQIEPIKQQIAEYDSICAEQKEYAAYDMNVSKYNQRLQNVIYEQEIAEHQYAEKKHTESLTGISEEITKYTNSIQNIHNLKVKYAEIKSKIIELDDTLNLYETYYSCINYKTGIPSSILKQACSVLSEQCNHILSNITDFNVEFIFEEDIKIYTIAKGADNINMRLAASLGSGFQKFLLDMIMRIVLTRISNISNPNILFVDEGFGCLDKENFSSVCSCLTKLKNNFDAMIVITHIPELQSYMDQNMQVYQDDGLSQLHSGHLLVDQYDLFENANLRIIKQTIEAKDAAALDPNPEIIIPKQIELTPVPVQNQSVQTAPENIWSGHFADLCTRFNCSPDTIMEEILHKIILNAENKYTCIPCNKIFKKREIAESHLNAKTYKAKHLRHLCT